VAPRQGLLRLSNVKQALELAITKTAGGYPLSKSFLGAKHKAGFFNSCLL